MDENMQEKQHLETVQCCFIRILKHLGISMEETIGIMTFIGPNEEQMVEIVDKLEEKNFELTPRETMNIVGHVIEKYL